MGNWGVGVFGGVLIMMKVCALCAKKLIFKNFEGLDDHYECFFFGRKGK